MYKRTTVSLSAALGLALLSFSLVGCSQVRDKSDMQTRSMVVTASAYTTAESETKKGNVGLAAWGDQLKPGMKAIAVSRDLIDEGLTHNTKVKIEGLKGEYRVLDKMNKRWTKKIDIFMGTNRAKALQWGAKEVTITWQVPSK